MPKQQKETCSCFHQQFYNPKDHIVWKLNKAIYGLRSSPKAWQNHLAETLQQLGTKRLAASKRAQRLQDSNRHAFILVYVDDLLFLGDPTVVNKLFADIRQQLLLRPTGDLTEGNNVNFLGRISPTSEITTRSAWQPHTQQNC